MNCSPDIDKLTVELTDDITVALRCFNRTAQCICFVVDKNDRIVGILKVRDIYDKLSQGADKSDNIASVMETEFESLPVTSSESEIKSILSPKKRHIPLLDEDNRPVDYASRHKYESIPIMKPELRGNELAYVKECVKTNWISSQGRFVKKFETMVADYCGVPRALAVSNGTVALHLALETLGIGEGDEVIVPNFTFAASVNSVIHAGATPVLVDICEDTWLIDPEEAKAAITNRTEAIMPVHLYGQPCDMESINRLAREYDLSIIEDSAEAIGSKYKGKHVGSLGNVGTFSFYGNKTVTTGEGGMILFKDKEDYNRAAKLRDHGMSSSRRYWHDEIGYNYRMTNMQAAVGVAQMERIEKIVDKKIDIGKKYEENLREVEEVRLPADMTNRKNTYWLFTVVLEEGCEAERDNIVSKMSKNGIDARPVFYPIHEMPPYKDYIVSNPEESIKVSKNGISFPSYTELENDDIEYICEVFKSALVSSKVMLTKTT